MTNPTPSDSVEEPRDPRKGPLSFFSGAVTAGFLAWLALGLTLVVLRSLFTSKDQNPA